MARHDDEYERNAVADLFMVFAPLEGGWQVKVTDRHTAIDYAARSRTFQMRIFPVRRKACSCKTVPSTKRFEWRYIPKYGS